MDSPSSLSHSAPTGIARFAAIEAGGTKFNVGIGTADGKLISQSQFATRSPEETMRDVTAWLDAEVAKDGSVAAIGLATFGPVDTDPGSPRWGHLGPTPKLSWRDADLISPLRGYNVPVALDTDVNGAALAEWRWGAGRDCKRISYITVGTGIGGGAVIDGEMLSGRNHPEMGHMFIHRHADDDFEGACPSHGDCLEGLASGNAINARWGNSLSKLGTNHPSNRIIAYYLAQACINIVGVLAPEKIIVGGGVIGTSGLIDEVQGEFQRLANDYFTGFAASDIVLAQLFPISGLIGGLAMAEMALNRSRA